ncbi:MAG TPA: hypothetical protein DCM67_00475 [Propionibacteriaceae bacterium]|nr:hypothetical protein [Propionibacteriaceae bacterium]
MSTARLWWLLQQRSRREKSAATRFTGVLAVIAFAATSAVALVVVGGLQAFIRRGADPTLLPSDPGVGGFYVILAWIAVFLLLVPLSTLGAAAARLAMARRDERLAALRLVGATRTQVGALTLADAGLQAGLGAVLGIVGYLAALPALSLLSFEGRALSVAELWVGLPLLLATIAAVVAVALISALSSLQRVSITPLGVAARASMPLLSAFRLVVLGLVSIGGVVAFNVLGSVAGMIGIVIAAGFVALGLATMNLIGPFVLQLVGRITAALARRPETLLAGRRLAADPKAAWRSVGGVGLAAFIAGVVSLVGMFAEDPASGSSDQLLVTDLVTGGLLTLVIAGVLAAVSTGVMQAGRLIDQRQEYRNLVLAGAEVRMLSRARTRETVIPLVAALGTATGSVLIVVVPMIGMSAYLNPAVLMNYALSVLGVAAVVMVGAWASGFVARGLTADLRG